MFLTYSESLSDKSGVSFFLVAKRKIGLMPKELTRQEGNKGRLSQAEKRRSRLELKAEKMEKMRKALEAKKQSAGISF